MSKNTLNSLFYKRYYSTFNSSQTSRGVAYPISSCHSPPIPQPIVMWFLCLFSIEPALPIACKLSQKAESDTLQSWFSIYFCDHHPWLFPESDFHPLFILVVSSINDLSTLTPTSLTNNLFKSYHLSYQ